MIVFENRTHELSDSIKKELKHCPEGVNPLEFLAAHRIGFETRNARGRAAINTIGTNNKEKMAAIRYKYKNSGRY